MASSTAEPSTLITQEHHDKLNVWSEPRVSYAIDRSDIRRWAIAVYWPDKPPPLYWDEAYAKTTRWGGIVAPREFNPFAWPIDRPAGYGGPKKGAGKGERTLNGGQTETYGVPMRPGDVITSRIALVKFEERHSPSLGLMLYTYSEMKWTNQRDEFVRSRISVVLRY